MGMADDIWNAMFKNPVSTSLITSIKTLFNSAIVSESPKSASLVKLPPGLEKLTFSKLVTSGNVFVRLAGVSGATAVILGAYGAHSMFVKPGYEEQKRIYQTANHYQFIHSLALFGAPLCRFPVAAGSFLTLGVILFCGSCYYEAFTGKQDFRKITPVGGTCLILGWIALVF